MQLRLELVRQRQCPNVPVCRAGDVRYQETCKIASKMIYEHVAIAQKEPYILTHSLDGHVAGSTAKVCKWEPGSIGFVMRKAEQHLSRMMRDWRERSGYDVQGWTAKVVGKHLRGMLLRCLDGAKAPAHAVHKERFWLPRCKVWAGGKTVARCWVTPICIPTMELNPLTRVARVVSLHVCMPLRPDVVIAASDCLSLSLPPGHGRMLVDLPHADNRPEAETMTAAAILLTRTSAMADLAITNTSTVSTTLLRPGAHVRRIKDHVASTGGRWVFRHAMMAYDHASAPSLVHPLGHVDNAVEPPEEPDD